MEPGIVVRVEDAEEAAEDDDDDQSGMSACDFEEDFDRQADVERGYMFTQEDFDRIKFEAESVKKMWELEVHHPPLLGRPFHANFFGRRAA